MTNPPIYFTRENGKLALCLSNFAKWAAGILAAFIVGGTAWFFNLTYSAAENSRMALMEIRRLDDKLDGYKADSDKHFERLENRIDANDERDYQAHGKGMK
jgi:uncharacterized membrane-anchored protein YhcB (DUF1043 family)